MAFRNKQIEEIVKESFKNATGKEFTGIKTSEMVDVGNPEFPQFIEQFTQQIHLNIIKNIFENDKYDGLEKDVFYKSYDKFASIVRSLNFDVPDAKENSAWKNFQNGDVAGTFEIALPTVRECFWGKTTSWAIPLTYSTAQWRDIVSSDEELENWISQLMVAVKNKITISREQLTRNNRNNFIANKIKNHYKRLSNPSLEGITDSYLDLRVINLIDEYIKENGLENTPGKYTVKWFMNNKDCLNFAVKRILTITEYMKGATTLFNDSKEVYGEELPYVFTPEDRRVVQLLSSFTNAIESVANSNTFHNMMSLPNHTTVPFWQSLFNGRRFETEIGERVEDEFTRASSIYTNVTNVDFAEYEVFSGIVGLICDERCVMHTQMEDEPAVEYDKIRRLVHTEWQFRDMYLNNLSLNACVLLLEDIEITE